MTRRQEYVVFCQCAVGATLAVAMVMLAACSASPQHAATTTTTLDQPAVVTLRPPQVRDEVTPAPPSDRVAWDPGHWAWKGAGYFWTAGHWVDRPYANAMWQPGHWVDHGNGWVWDEGHWRA